MSGGRFLLACALLATPQCARNEPQRTHDVQLVACEAPGYPNGARCGTYRVWENRAARSGRQIELNVLILPALEGPKALDPVFYFDGGPGAAATQAAGYVGRLLRDVNKSRDLVFVDIRGTGRSNPLTCPQPGPDAPLQAYFRDFLADDYVRECLAAQTADVRFYTQPLAMDDVDDLRQALGYARINLFGSSGGTRQEQLYMRRHGDAVRAVVMHGVQAMDGEMPLPFSRALEDGLRGLIEGCERDDGCRARYPRLRGDWDAVKRRFDAGGVETTVTEARSGRTERVRISRGVYADGLRHMLYSLNGAASIRAEIHRAAAGDFAPFAERELAQVRRFADAISDGLFLTATCAEDVRFIDEQDIERATSGTFLGDYRVRRQQSACRIWPPGEAIDPDFQKAVTLDVPVLIISGEFDVATPPSEAERVARALPNARHIVFPNQSHDFAHPDCASRLIADFITTADASRLDVACVAEAKRPMLSGAPRR